MPSIYSKAMAWKAPQFFLCVIGLTLLGNIMYTMWKGSVTAWQPTMPPQITTSQVQNTFDYYKQLQTMNKELAKISNIVEDIQMKTATKPLIIHERQEIHFNFSAEYYPRFDLRNPDNMDEMAQCWRHVCQQKDSCSQHKQDAILFAALWRQPLKRGGIFVEIGGFDGITYSNSLFFEHCLQWNGLLIEADPISFHQLLQSRPNVTALEGAVCAESGVVQFSQSGKAFATNGIVDRLDKELTEMWHQKPNIIDVKCHRMSQYFEEAKISRIDFLSIDVEGAEYDVITTIDWNRIQVHVVIVEVFEFRPEKNDMVRKYLSNLGLTHIPLPFMDDDVWVNMSYVPSDQSYYPLPHSYTFRTRRD